jgi:hypothetical protein
MKEIQTVGRRRLVVRLEAGHVKIDVLWKKKRLATLDLEQQAAAELEQALREKRREFQRDVKSATKK